MNELTRSQLLALEVGDKISSPHYKGMEVSGAPENSKKKVTVPVLLPNGERTRIWFDPSDEPYEEYTLESRNGHQTVVKQNCAWMVEP